MRIRDSNRAKGTRHLRQHSSYVRRSRRKRRNQIPTPARNCALSKIWRSHEVFDRITDFATAKSTSLVIGVANSSARTSLCLAQLRFCQKAKTSPPIRQDGLRDQIALYFLCGVWYNISETIERRDSLKWNISFM